MTEQSLKDKTAKGLFLGRTEQRHAAVAQSYFRDCISRILDAEDYGMIGMLSIFSLIASTLQEADLPPHLPIRKISAMKTTMQSFGSVCLQVGCFTYYYFSYPHTLQSFTILRH